MNAIGDRRETFTKLDPGDRKFGWPRCYVCKRGVERLEQISNVLGRTTTFAVYCHGAREIVEVPDEMIQDGRITLDGVAFLPPKALGE